MRLELIDFPPLLAPLCLVTFLTIISIFNPSLQQYGNAPHYYSSASVSQMEFGTERNPASHIIAHCFLRLHPGRPANRRIIKRARFLRCCEQNGR